ncbi:hypothetical protein U1839_26360 [Sphingomonas sp. RT2P30]|uniref:hypothetical protein n=1 Tax=Parasphingomonas halimpatiens TaxID=3096162 RepID=UPI002FC8919A
MDNLDAVMGDAKGWLAAQPDPEEGSAAWYGFQNFRQFIASLDNDPSTLDLEQACYALGWHISDHYGTYDELPTIALFNDRVRRITKAMLWRE